MTPEEQNAHKWAIGTMRRMIPWALFDDAKTLHHRTVGDRTLFRFTFSNPFDDGDAVIVRMVCVEPGRRNRLARPSRAAAQWVEGFTESPFLPGALQ